jgi:hypothetical protein
MDAALVCCVTKSTSPSAACLPPPFSSLSIQICCRSPTTNHRQQLAAQCHSQSSLPPQQRCLVTTHHAPRPCLSYAAARPLQLPTLRASEAVDYLPDCVAYEKICLLSWITIAPGTFRVGSPYAAGAGFHVRY